MFYRLLFTRFLPLQEGQQDELSSYPDDVFETASEAALQHLDERELTGSALDKCELERSHLMLCVYLFGRVLSYSSLSDRLIYTDSFSFVCLFCLIQPIRARMEEGQKQLCGPTQGTSKAGSSECQRAPGTRTEDCGSS